MASAKHFEESEPRLIYSQISQAREQPLCHLLYGHNAEKEYEFQDCGYEPKPPNLSL